MNEKLAQAIAEAIRNSEKFMNGAAVLEQDGEYIVTSPLNAPYYPEATTVYTVTDPTDEIGSEVSLDEVSDETLLDYVKDAIIPDLNA
jgi:hypothetical protein